MPQGRALMVFDDITELVSAQRVEAWSEVARRLAHEIKNPLTPIQLSAERLQLKLAPKLEGSDQAMLHRSVDTIVNQVQAMKTLVNEFRDYARLPASQLVPLDLNALVGEVLGLYGSAQESGRLPRRARQRAAADRRRRHPAAPGDPQPGAERARLGGRPARRAGAGLHRGGRKRAG
jgi:nitrogen fixation/metabolism regulation signal transduction histidine kinase